MFDHNGSLLLAEIDVARVTTELEFGSSSEVLTFASLVLKSLFFFFFFLRTAVLNSCLVKIDVSRDPGQHWGEGHISALFRIPLQQVTSFLAVNHQELEL